jgi:hypothetical protein
VPGGGPWSFGPPTPLTAYTAARPRPVLADPSVSDLALQTLVRRYLEGFGPASIADMARFALVPVLADREPEVYRRYHHWWARLPDAETRLLSG